MTSLSTSPTQTKETDMTDRPASTQDTETIRRAAVLLRKLDRTALPAPWSTSATPNGSWKVNGKSEQVAVFDVGHDADVTATMRNVVGMLAEWLHSAADDAEAVGADPHAVAVARVLLAEASR